MLGLIRIRNIISLLSFEDRTDCDPSVGQTEALPGEIDQSR